MFPSRGRVAPARSQTKILQLQSALDCPSGRCTSQPERLFFPNGAKARSLGGALSPVPARTLQCSSAGPIRSNPPVPTQSPFPRGCQDAKSYIGSQPPYLAKDVPQLIQTDETQ